MALPQIRLFNLTGSDIDLTQLAVTVPASPGSVIVSEFNFTDEILNDEQLQTELGAGSIRIDIVGGGLSSSDTVKTVEQSKSLIKPLHDLDIKHNLAGAVAPIATDDEDSGYSVGSIWIDETGDAAYICVDATATAAVWNSMGGASTWAAVLAAGQVSGGTDPVISSGDTLRGVDSTVAAGGILAMRGGDTTFAGLVNGGDVTLDGGDYGGTSGFARGGNVTISGGTATAGTGGSVSIFGATPSGVTGTGGAIFITTGEGATGGGNANGGNLNILTGDGKVSGQGGSISIAAGFSPNFGFGADVDISAGDCTGGSGFGGDLTLDAGDGSKVGGDVFITAGAKTVAFGSFPRNTGNVVITSGSTTVNGTTVGSITLETPSVNAPGDNSTGGSINLITGDSGASNSNVCNLNITLGSSNAGATNRAGSMLITLGDDIAGSASSEGGEFDLVCGDTNVGTAGGFTVLAGSSTGANAIGGSISITSGAGGTSSGANGDIKFACLSAAGSSAKGGSILGEAGDGGNTGNGGDVSWTAGEAGAASGTGGTASLTGGASTGAASGGVTNVVAGAGGATGNGGKVSVVAGAGGATSGNGGLAAIEGGTPTDGDGGGVSIAGKAGVGVDKSGGVIDINAGDSTGLIAGAAVNIAGGDGSAASTGGNVNIDGGAGRIGGDVVITSGPPLAALQAGDIFLIAERAGGAPGKIHLTTESDDLTTAPVTIDTQSGFADQGENHRTFGRSEAIAINTLNQAVVNLGSIANGEQIQVKVSLTAVDTLVDTNVASFRFDGDFYGSGGVVTAMTPHVNTNTLVGSATFTGGISFAVVISGGTILLEVSNSSLVSAFTLDISATFITQQGGASS